MSCENERQRQRYADDPEYRRRKLARARKSHARRYADPDTRRQIIAQNRARYEANKRELAQRRRLRYRTDAEYRERRRASARKHGRKYQLRRYGLSTAAYDAMHAAQGGVCAICRQPDDPLFVDHDHVTRRVRRLLCLKCNCGLGYFGDDPRLTWAATLYLLEWLIEQQDQPAPSAPAAAGQADAGRGVSPSSGSDMEPAPDHCCKELRAICALDG
jgi:hypothetical protein